MCHNDCCLAGNKTAENSLGGVYLSLRQEIGLNFDGYSWNASSKKEKILEIMK